MKFIETKNNADILILVTHYEYTVDFPKYFAENYWKDYPYKSQIIGKGQARVIDLENKNFDYIHCM